MTFEKALRILPSFVSHVAKGQTDLESLRLRVRGELKQLHYLIFEKLRETHSGSFKTDEAKAIDLKIDQLNRFLENTGGL